MLSRTRTQEPFPLVPAIVTTAEYETYLGATTGDAIVASLHSGVERSVARYLGYHPVQAARTQFYPRGSKPGLRGGGAGGSGSWETQGGRAVFSGGGGGRAADLLQLQHLPIRGQPRVFENLSAKFGAGSSPFPASSELTYGTDFWMAVKELDGNDSEICTDGMLIRSGAWSVEPGTLKVIYTAGWTVAELKYDLATEPPSLVDASTISLACKELMAKCFKTRTAHKIRLGDPSGLVLMERMGDYMYQNDVLSMRRISGFEGLILTEIAEMLHEYRNMGFLAA